MWDKHRYANKSCEGNPLSKQNIDSLMFSLYPFFWISFFRSLRNIEIVLRFNVCSPSNFRFCFFERTWSNAYWLSYHLLYEHFLLFHTSLPKKRKKKVFITFCLTSFAVSLVPKGKFSLYFLHKLKGQTYFLCGQPTEPPSFAKEQLLSAFAFTRTQLNVAYIKNGTDVDYKSRLEKGYYSQLHTHLSCHLVSTILWVKLSVLNICLPPIIWHFSLVLHIVFFSSNIYHSTTLFTQV